MNLFDEKFPVDALVSQAFSGTKVTSIIPYSFHSEAIEGGGYTNMPTAETSAYIGYLTSSGDSTSRQLGIRGVNIELPVTQLNSGHLVIFDTIDDGDTLDDPIQFIGYRTTIQGWTQGGASQVPDYVEPFIKDFFVGIVHAAEWWSYGAGGVSQAVDRSLVYGVIDPVTGGGNVRIRLLGATTDFEVIDFVPVANTPFGVFVDDTDYGDADTMVLEQFDGANWVEIGTRSLLDPNFSQNMVDSEFCSTELMVAGDIITTAPADMWRGIDFIKGGRFGGSLLDIQYDGDKTHSWQVAAPAFTTVAAPELPFPIYTPNSRYANPVDGNADGLLTGGVSGNAVLWYFNHRYFVNNVATWNLTDFIVAAGETYIPVLHIGLLIP